MNLLHCPLEQQKIFLHKQNLNTEFNTRFSLLALGNFQFSQYNRALSCKENINLKESLIRKVSLKTNLERV